MQVIKKGASKLGLETDRHGAHPVVGDHELHQQAVAQGPTSRRRIFPPIAI